MKKRHLAFILLVVYISFGFNPEPEDISPPPGVKVIRSWRFSSPPFNDAFSASVELFSKDGKITSRRTTYENPKQHFLIFYHYNQRNLLSKTYSSHIADTSDLSLIGEYQYSLGENYPDRFISENFGFDSFGFDPKGNLIVEKDFMDSRMFGKTLFLYNDSNLVEQVIRLQLTEGEIQLFVNNYSYLYEGVTLKSRTLMQSISNIGKGKIEDLRPSDIATMCRSITDYHLNEEIFFNSVGEKIITLYYELNGKIGSTEHYSYSYY